MTMDYGQQSRADLKLSSPRVGAMESPNSIVTAAANTSTTDIVQTTFDQNPSSTTKSPVKRSFDVAFLIRPDENMKHKQARTNMLAIATEQAVYHQHSIAHQPHQLNHLNHNHRQSPDVEDTTPSPSSHASPTPPQPSPSHNMSSPQQLPQLHHISVKSDEVLRGGSVVGAKQLSPPPRYAEFSTGEPISNDMLINRSDYDRYNRVLAARMPRVYDHPSAIVLSATAASDTIVVDDKKDDQPRSAFTKVPSQHHHQLIHHMHQQTQHQIHHHQLHNHQHHQHHHQHLHPIESPPGPVASPDRLSCPSISPPVSITPPASRAASITQSPPPPMPSPSASQMMALASAPSPPQSHLMYQNIRPEYRQFVSAAAAAGQFQTISHHLQQAAAVSQQQQQQFKQHQQQHQQQQQFMYRTSAANSPAAAAAAAAAALAANAEHMSHINKFMGTPQQFAAVQQHFAAQQQHQQHQHNQQQLQQHHHHHHHHQQHQQQQQQQHQQQQQQHPQHAELAAAAVRHPATAAALLTSLIPPTLATSFTLTAQNVCAKCNISFRMTSDLVYHMRSHHKSEFTADTNRRKREEKLKCPVCNESFRERHHLTRHMTAHQDKASDEAPQSTAANTSGGSHGSTGSELSGLHPRMRHHK